MPGITIAKADTEDLQTTLSFLNACEGVLEHERFSMHDPASAWKNWDDEDKDKIKILKIQKWLSEQEGCKPEYLDDRILMYEFLQEKFKDCSCNWRRVYWAADVLIKNCTDPMLDHLAFHPGFELNHVSNEQ